MSLQTRTESTRFYGFEHAIVLEVIRAWTVLETPLHALTDIDRVRINMAERPIPYSGPVVTRAEARAAGLKRYFTGELCKRGHIAERRVSNWNCEECIKEVTAVWRHANPKKITAYNSKQYAKDAQAARIRSAEFYWNNRDAVAARHAANYAKDHAPNRARARAYAELHKEDLREKRAIYYAKNVDRLRAEARKYGAANKELKRLRDAAKRVDPEWQEKNKLWQVAWRKANIEICRAYTRNRSARRKAAAGTHTASDIRDIMRMQRSKCAYCKDSLRGGFHVDHIYPLSKGGRNDRANLQLTCATCNTSKGALDPLDFARRVGRLV